MDRTEEYEELRKELLRVRIEATKHKRQPEIKEQYDKKAKILHDKMSKLILSMIEKGQKEMNQGGKKI